LECPLLHSFVTGVGAAPLAGRIVHHVAFNRIGTAAGDDAGRLIGQKLGGVNDCVLKSNLVANVLAILDFAYLPGSFCHTNLRLMFIVYGMSDNLSSDRRHQMA